MKILEYGVESEMVTGIQVEDRSVRSQTGSVTGVIFRGYPVLHMDDLSVEDCVFENCRTVCFSDCKVDMCRFSGVETVYADRSPINGCNFEHLRCDNDCALSLEDCEVLFCTFKDIELSNEAYLINGTSDVWVESCIFENIRTDRKDRELFFCEETVGKILKKKVQFCIADTASCSGLNGVKYTLEDQTPEDPLEELWLKAAERGIRVEKAIEAVREGIRWDVRQWDAHILRIVFGDRIAKIPVYNCLTRAGLRTVGDLAKLDIEQILSIRSISKTTVAEVVNLLHSLGVTGSAWDYLV